MSVMDYSEEYTFVWKLRKYLLLLATLVVSATYVAGLNPPGGLFVDDEVPHRVGDPVLASTNSTRYDVFLYCNAAAFLASLVIVMALLDHRIVGNRVGLTVLRSAMVLDLVALMGAFAAGSCRNVRLSVYVPAAFAVLMAYVAIHLLVAASPLKSGHAGHSDAEEGRLKGRWKLPLLLATFVTPLTYGAGLVPPGGSWFDSGNFRGQVAGDPMLQRIYPLLYFFFFLCNPTCFVSSLVIITLLLSRSLSGRVARSYALQVCVLAELLCLMGAYAAGSPRFLAQTVHIIFLAGLMLVIIALVGKFSMDRVKKLLARRGNLEQESPHEVVHPGVPNEGDGSDVHILVESQSLLLLLATLITTVTYQEGLNPPGGYWRDEDIGGFRAGHPSLLDVLPNRYSAFFHCNTMAFVASLVVIVIVQSKRLLMSGAAIRLQVLQVAIVLSLFGLMGAYTAGSCRDIATTIYISALAVANVVAFIILGSGSKRSLWVEATVYMGLKKLHLLDDDHDDQAQSKREEVHSLKKKRKSLLQLAILVATATYQTGLNSAGGFWEVGYAFYFKKHLTDTLLLGYDPRRYLVFFYCNAAEFMASVAVILLLVNRRLHKQSIRSNVLQACIMIGFMALRTAYTVGSTHRVSTSIYVYGLVAAVIAYVALQLLPLLFARCVGRPTAPRLPAWLRKLFEPLSLMPDAHNTNLVQQQYTDKHIKHKYMMLLAILTASLTYQAGLVPPGGTWAESTAHVSPIGKTNLQYSRYAAFFYCNAKSFAASVTLIVLLLQRTVSRRGAPLRAMQAAMVLDLAGLLGAYAAGTCWVWEQVFAYLTTLVAAVVVYVTLHVLMWRRKPADPAAPPTTPDSSHHPVGSIVNEL
ncbi:hypothetical protein VPH35_087035 [Triticum aestivum]